MRFRFNLLPAWKRTTLAIAPELLVLAFTARYPLMFIRTPWLLSVLAVGIACALGEFLAAFLIVVIGAIGINRIVLVHATNMGAPQPLQQTVAFILVASVLTFLVRQRNVALHAAEASESHYRSLAETASDVIISIDSDSRILSVNPAVRQVFGYEPAELVGQRITELMPERLRSRHLHGLQRFVQTGERNIPWNGIQLMGLHKNGRELPIEVSFGVHSHGAAKHFTGIIRDISERRKIHDALMESEKLAAVGRLASSIAHEINNPLEAITNLLYLAQRSQDSQQVRELLASADVQLRRVSVIANQTLEFHKTFSEAKEVPAKLLMAESLALFQGKLANLRVEVQERYRGTCPALCVEGEVRQVMQNLISNALDSLGAGPGRLLLRTRDATQWSTGRRGVMLTVADTGPGISPETKQKMFEAFFSTKEKDGVGLGLWISSQLIQHNAGQLRVRSSVQPQRHGAVFCLFLPSASSNTQG